MRERIAPPGRSAGARDLGQHLPLGVRADPAPRGRERRLRPRLHHLRRRRPAAADPQGLRRRAGRPQADRPARRAGADLGRQEPADGPRGRGRRRSARSCDEQIARRLPALRRRPARQRRDGLRRPPDAAGRGCSRATPAVREHWQRRFRHVLVDEYQDTNHAQYRLRAGARRAAAQRGRGGRRRPVDLLLARRRRAQHPRLRAATTPTRDRGAGAELPLHQHDPARRQRGDRATTPTATPSTSGPTAARASRSQLAACRDEHEEARVVAVRDRARARAAASRCRTSRSSTAPTPRAGRSRTSWCAARIAYQRDRRAAASTSAPRCATCSPTCAWWPTRPTR